MYLLHYKLQSHQFSIQTGNKKLADFCSQLYPNCRSKRSGRADIVYSLKMKNNSNASTIYEVLVDGNNKYQTTIKSELFSSLEWMITCNALSHLHEFFQLHAGAVVKDEKIILLPANHGQGKTTLTLSLIKDHYRCLSDDIVLIDPETIGIVPFPRNFLIKDKSINELAGSHLIDKKNGYYCKSEDILYYNPYPENKPSTKNAKPYAIIELKHGRRFNSELRPVSKSEMCIKLLKQSFNIHNYKRDGVTILAKLVRESKCYSLKTNSVEDAVRLVSQI